MDKTNVRDPHNFILKRRIETYDKNQMAFVDVVIGQTEKIGREAQNIFKKMNQSPKKYQFKPMELNKPPKLTLNALQIELESLMNWQNKFLKYCLTDNGYRETQALEYPSAPRDIMSAFIDDHILARTEKKLLEVKTVKELFQVLKDEEQVILPAHK